VPDRDTHVDWTGGTGLILKVFSSPKAILNSSENFLSQTFAAVCEK